MLLTHPSAACESSDVSYEELGFPRLPTRHNEPLHIPACTMYFFTRRINNRGIPNSSKCAVTGPSLERVTRN